MSWTKWLLLTLLLFLFIAVPLARQLNQSQTGCVEGMVVDEKGAPVPAASIEARNTIRGLVSRGSSHADGRYAIDNLAPGKYSLWAEAKGYTCEWVPQVIVEEGKHTRQDFRLTCELRDNATVPVR
jgi:hypothetical protein